MTPVGPYTPTDGKKEPPADYEYEQRFPLSGNGNAAPPESKKWSDSTPVWLGMYFFFNLGLTLFNKVVLVSFPFPYVSASREMRC